MSPSDFPDHPGSIFLPFRIFRGPLFHKPVTFFAVSYRKQTLRACCPNIYTVYKGDQWVGYDDIEMIRYKSQYIRKMGLGGGMTWALDLDDFMNRCGQGYHPLMNTIKKVLGPRRTSGE